MHIYGIQGVILSSSTFILRLSRPVSADMLDDLRAVFPSDATQVFINALDEGSYTTVECLQSDDTCALAASAIAPGGTAGSAATPPTPASKRCFRC